MSIEDSLARIEISTLKARHLRHLDTKDWDGYAALLTEDYELDLSAMADVPVIKGRDAATNSVRSTVGPLVSVHQLHQPRIVIDGDQAYAVWVIQGLMVPGEGQPAQGGTGLHQERWVKRDGKWKLASQALTGPQADWAPPASSQPKTGGQATPKDQQKIDDWFAICAAKAKYCRALDAKDWAGFANLMTEDYVMDVSEGTDVPIIHGRDAAIKEVQKSILTAQTAHQVHAPEIELDGDEARVIWALEDRLIWGPDKPTMTGYGHYHERWIKQNGAWKLAAIKLTRLHVDFKEPAQAA
jgi:ketosteroid isomerase-like protein